MADQSLVDMGKAWIQNMRDRSKIGQALQTTDRRYNAEGQPGTPAPVPGTPPNPSLLDMLAQGAREAWDNRPRFGAGGIVQQPVDPRAAMTPEQRLAAANERMRIQNEQVRRAQEQAALRNR